jgi:hypothetical protein
LAVDLRQKLDDKEKYDEEERRKIKARLDVAESDIVNIKVDIGDLKDWRDQMEADKLEARMQAAEDMQDGEGDDGCGGEEKKKKKPAVKNKITKLAKKGKKLHKKGNKCMKNTQLFEGNS